MIPAVDNNHVAEGIALLTDRYRTKVNIPKLLTALLKPTQDLENAIWSVINAYMISTPPVGQQLQDLGALVGQSRSGLSDADFLTAIKLRILANRSAGRAEDILGIAHVLSLGAPAGYYESYPAGFTVEISDVTNASVAVSLLTEAKPVGVRGVVHYTTWPDGSDFVWGSHYQSSAGELGYGTIYDSRAHGGLLAAAAELRVS